MSPRNDAHALHDLLCRLLEKDPVTLHLKWAQILECEYNSMEYARRFSEVVALFNGTVAQVVAMPEATRVRFERYVFQWWRAIIAPQHAWSNPVSPVSLLAREELDQLASAADLIDYRMGGSLAVPESDDLNPLREQCEEWIAALQSEDEIPQPLRLNLLQDLEHIVWLIDNADLFGVARVTAASQAAVGGMAIVTTRVKPAKARAWVARVGKFVNALVTLSALLQGIDVGLELTGDAADIISELTAGSGEGAGLSGGSNQNNQ